MAGCLAVESQKTGKLGLGTSAANKARLPYLAFVFFELGPVSHPGLCIDPRKMEVLECYVANRRSHGSKS